jgi:hypothetical protein
MRLSSGGTRVRQNAVSPLQRSDEKSAFETKLFSNVSQNASLIDRSSGGSDKTVVAVVSRVNSLVGRSC